VLPGDFPTVVGLLREVDLPPDGLEQQFGDSYAVALRDGSIVGIAGIETYGSYGLLRSVAVSPEVQTTTASGYFERFGFSAVDRERVPPEVKKSREFSSICPTTATVMMCKLHSQRVKS
jgi:amino-acid N-acetyltransferase